MNRPQEPNRIDSVAVDAPPLVETAPVAVPQAAARIELGGDEIIQLSIRPSPWFIAISSIGWLAVVVLLLVVVALGSGGSWIVPPSLACQALVGVAAARLGIATLQWASRLYVLTNRRVLRFKGIHNVHVAECPLAQVSAVQLQVPWYGWLLRLGSVRITPADPKLSTDPRLPTICWRDVARPQEVHEWVTRAVRKAQNRP